MVNFFEQVARTILRNLAATTSGHILVQIVSTLTMHPACHVPIVEAAMRVIFSTFAGLGALAAVSVQAAPVPLIKATPADLSTVPPFQLVAQDCGPGWHRHHWRDYWGRWHWGRCHPNG